MRKICLCTLVLLSIAGKLHARVLTVSNLASKPAQYSTIFDVMMFAQPFDTIYVHGSPLSYGDVTIYNPLTIIGTGHNPQKPSPVVSMFGNITVTASTVRLIGLTMVSLSGSTPQPTDTLRVTRCKFAGSNFEPTVSFGGSGVLLVEGSIIEPQIGLVSITYGAAAQLIVRNNIIKGPVFQISPSTSALAHIHNNIFLGSYDAFPGMTYALIENNIFYTAKPTGFFLPTNMVMRSNISYLGLSSYGPPWDDFGANNMIANPRFLNVPDGTAFNYNYYYQLTGSSPGLSMGTDGTDIGVYGGDGLLFTMTGEPAIALITEFTFTSPSTVAPGGTLSISIKSKSSP